MNKINRHPAQCISRIKSGFPRHGYTVWGFDTEFCTQTGQTVLMALTDGENDYAYDAGDFFEAFLVWVSQVPNYSVLFAHNATVDLVALLAGTPLATMAGWWRRRRLYWSQINQSTTLDLFLGKPCFGRIIVGRKTIYLRDTSQWFNGSLETIAGDLLGEKKELIDFLTAAPQKLTDYCIRDARLVQKIGQRIIDQHQKDDLSLAVTGAHQSSRFVRKQLDDDLPPLSKEQAHYGHRAYCGGRIMAFCKGTIEGDLYKYDLQSAYMGALRLLPSAPMRSSRTISPWGVYRAVIRTDAPSLPYRDTQGRLRYPVGQWEGYFTGVELLAFESARWGAVLSVVWGWEFPPTQSRPFAAGVERALQGREQAQDKTSETAFKQWGNSIYGRMASAPGGKAGGDYHPIYAALITGWVRAQVLALGRAAPVLSIQTDSVWMLGNKHAPPTNKQAGAWKLEYQCDRLTLIRSACYIPWAGQVPVWDHTKLHGYQGAKPDFIEALTAGRYALSKWITPALSTPQQPPNTIQDTWAQFNCWTPDKKMIYYKLTQGAPQRLLHEKEYGRPISMEDL